MHAQCPLKICCCATGLLEEREESVYKVAAGYSEKATSLFTLDLGPPQDLPDALRGESWMFVQVPASAHNPQPFACNVKFFSWVESGWGL